MDVEAGPHGEVVVRVEETFDAKAAARLTGWLGEVPPDRRVVLDFGRARGCDDVALASLARGLSARAGLVVHGLARRHERMLRYFGVELAAAWRADERDVA